VERIYHRYENWECWKSGFFNNVSGENKKLHIENVVKIFSSQELTEKYMTKVINQWVYSCEHNLSNNQINKIAWLSQAACCLHSKIPCSITMEAWHLVSKENRDKADEIAKRLIEQYELNHEKQKKLCPKLF